MWFTNCHLLSDFAMTSYLALMELQKVVSSAQSNYRYRTVALYMCFVKCWVVFRNINKKSLIQRVSKHCVLSGVYMYRLKTVYQKYKQILSTWEPKDNKTKVNLLSLAYFKNCPRNSSLGKYVTQCLTKKEYSLHKMQSLFCSDASSTSQKQFVIPLSGLLVTRRIDNVLYLTFPEVHFASICS